MYKSRTLLKKIWVLVFGFYVFGFSRCKGKINKLQVLQLVHTKFQQSFISESLIFFKFHLEKLRVVPLSSNLGLDIFLFSQVDSVWRSKLNFQTNIPLKKKMFLCSSHYSILRCHLWCKLLTLNTSLHVIKSFFRNAPRYKYLFNMVSTNQAGPGCCYFRISWILMERYWFYFFVPSI